ncbi:MAG: CHASE2 domain-containing protein [Elainellaceae cyanobacterium]
MIWARFAERVEPWLQGNRRVWLTASGVAVAVISLRLFGVFQTVELAALDQMFQWRPVEEPDDRIVIVGIDDDDIRNLGTWPITDEVMAQLLSQIQTYSPRAIGLDIYRDLPVMPGSDQLVSLYGEMPNLVGIEKLPDAYSVGIQPPEVLDDIDQIGFNNVLVDIDGKVRRSLLFWTAEGETHTSFALRLSQMYLAEDGIRPRPALSVNPDYMQLGDAVFRLLERNDGSYVSIDNGGYQIVTNYRTASPTFPTVSVTDVLNGDIPPDLLRDRIVLIGSTANSLQDFFYTPLSGRIKNNNRPIPGVEIHAQFVSQIISAALNGRSLIHYWSDPMEGLWIVLWSLVGAHLSWRVRSPSKSGLMLVAAGGILIGIGHIVFLHGWWIPIIPPMVAMVSSAVGIIAYIAHLEGELQKTKEFLHSIVNVIPDPVFVKDNQYQWIMVNEAFSRLLGHRVEDLIGKQEDSVLPSEQASAFYQHDQRVFQLGHDHESEDELTNAKGHTYRLSTKRTLHQDGAGNQFLVGVIHDITQRKRMEDELRRTAADLARSNAELQQRGARLQEIAYHDPLTGLPNRKLFQERLIQAIEWAEYNEQLIAVLFLDLDGFKAINDSFGHVVGDLLLKAVAKRLIGCLRSSDTVARLGGDEFVVILPAIPSALKAGQVADKILATLAEIFMLENYSIEVTTSIGISMYPQDGVSIETLIVEADRAMYQAKQLGKSQHIFASEPDKDPDREHPLLDQPGADRLSSEATPSNGTSTVEVSSASSSGSHQDESDASLKDNVVK